MNVVKQGIIDKAIDWKYSFDELDSFKDINHLANLIIGKIKTIFQDVNTIYFYIYNRRFKNYQEVHKEDLFTFTEDHPLITFLALKDELIYDNQILNEPYLQDEEIIKYIILEQLKIHLIIPVVQRFQLLGFIGLNFDQGQRILSTVEYKLLKELKRDVQLNLNAAILIENRFSELELLADIGNEITHSEDIEKLYELTFRRIHDILNYKTGIIRLLDKNEKKLEITASFGLAKGSLIAEIDVDDGISGHVIKSGKPLLIKNLESHVSLSKSKNEDVLIGSVLCFPLRTKDKIIGILTISNDSNVVEYSGENLYQGSIIAQFLATAIDNLNLYNSLEKTYFDTLSALISALDAKDPYTAGHSQRVMKYSEGISNELRLPAETIKMIKFAALLHDIGKIGIKGDIIKKRGKLTKIEYELMKAHPMIGEKIISSIDFLKDASQVLKYHHERLDGKGYPYQLTAEMIPLEARILQVADAFDALTSQRSYHRPITPKRAIDIMRKEIGTQFDKSIMISFVNYLIKEKLLGHRYKLIKKPRKKKKVKAKRKKL